MKICADFHEKINETKKLDPTGTLTNTLRTLSSAKKHACHMQYNLRKAHVDKKKNTDKLKTRRSD